MAKEILSPALRVGVDARCLNRPFVRGMGRYVKNVCEGVSRLDSVDWRLFADRPDLPFHAPDCPLVDHHSFELRGHRFQSWEQLGLPCQARRSRVDVLYCSATTLPWWQPVPAVVTVHDTIPWMREWDEGNESWYWNRLLPAALAKSAAIIAISESTAKDIADRWPGLAAKTRVIPHGVEDIFQQILPEPLSNELRALGIDGPYFLYVGGGVPRKRFEWARQVVSALENPSVQLVACGLERETRDKLREFVPDKCKVTACDYLGDDAMARLYQNAVGVLFPSLYEGFGFPPLEAQAVGTPVLFSAVGSLAELVGPGAVVLPPDDFEAWVATCRRLINQRGAGLLPDAESRRWARKFSWERSAREHLEVFRKSARVYGRFEHEAHRNAIPGEQVSA